MKHTPYDLRQMQSLPLEAKIVMTQQRIRQWYDYWEGDVYVSFSGGKDSTVLKHIVDGMYKDVPAVFVNTGLEYPEIQRFVKDIKAGKYDCFNSDVEICYPEMRFDEVIKKYGYPVVSKAVSRAIRYARKGEKCYTEMLNGEFKNREGGQSQYNISKWKYLLNSKFDISDNCCNVMKKKPLKEYSKQSKKKGIVATMACESRLRYTNWLNYGCNTFEEKEPTSKPLSFWTEQDILHYIKKYNVPYCSVYGEIAVDSEILGQLCLTSITEQDKLKTTGCNRTGCIFCMFGCHLEKSPNRFQQLKETHPKQYEYCINGGEYNEEGKWQPNKEGLGLAKVLDYIGVSYN